MYVPSFLLTTRGPSTCGFPAYGSTGDPRSGRARSVYGYIRSSYPFSPHTARRRASRARHPGLSSFGGGDVMWPIRLGPFSTPPCFMNEVDSAYPCLGRYSTGLLSTAGPPTRTSFA